MKISLATIFSDFKPVHASDEAHKIFASAIYNE